MPTFFVAPAPAQAVQGPFQLPPGGPFVQPSTTMLAGVLPSGQVFVSLDVARTYGRPSGNGRFLVNVANLPPTLRGRLPPVTTGGWSCRPVYVGGMLLCIVDAESRPGPGPTPIG
jgi:hypothetical protein